MQMCSYMFNAQYVVADLGPGNGRFNRNVIMTSHGIFIPLCIDGKARSTIASLAARLPQWRIELEQLRVLTNNVDNVYTLPDHVPKLLGVAFTRMGARGAIRPNNHFKAMIECLGAITSELIPAATTSGMALPMEQYQRFLLRIKNLVSRLGGGCSAWQQRRCMACRPSCRKVVVKLSLEGFGSS